MAIKIQETHIKYFFAVFMIVLFGFLGFVLFFSFLNEQSAWGTFLKICNGISVRCQEVLYGSVQKISEQKNLIQVIFGFLSGFFVLNIIIDIFRTNRFINSFKVLKKYNLGGNIKVVKSDKFEAFTGGLNPNIYISEKAVKELNLEELKAVVIHESCHLSKLDNLKNLIIRAMRSTFFFIPLIRDIEKIILQINENRADKKVSDLLENGEVHILSSLMKFSGSDARNLAISNFANRNLTLIHEKVNHYSINVVNLVFSILFILFSMFIMLRQNAFAQTLVETQCTASEQASVKESIRKNMSVSLPQSREIFSCY